MTNLDSSGPSRRRFLGLVGTAGAVGLAGCARSEAEPQSPIEGTEDSSDSVFRSLSFDLGDLVIELPEDHGVSQLSLVQADGTVFTSVRPDFAATTVRMAVADPEIGDADYVHYTPGVHELVAKIGDRIERHSINLDPRLVITGIGMYQEGSRPVEQGKITIRIHNEGTAPTWPYDSTFEDAPNWAADNPLGRFIGLPKVENTDDELLVLPPGEERTYVAARPPLLYDNDSPVDCSGETVDFRVIVGVADGSTLSVDARAVAEGNQIYATIHKQYVCSETDIEIING